MSTALTISGQELSSDEARAMLVLALEGGHASLAHLQQLDRLVSETLNSKPARFQDWERWLEGWEAEGWATKLVHFYHNELVYFLAPELRHRLLSEVSRTTMVLLLGTLEGYRRGERTLRKARLALYAGMHELFSELTSQDYDKPKLVELFGPSPAIEACALLPPRDHELLLEELGRRAMCLDEVPAEALLQSPVPAVAHYRIALHALSGNIESAKTEIEKADFAADKSGKLLAARVIYELAINDLQSARATAWTAVKRSQGKKKYPSLLGPLEAWSALCLAAADGEGRAPVKLLLFNPKGSDEHCYGVLAAFVDWFDEGADEPLQPRHWFDPTIARNVLANVFHSILASWKAETEVEGVRERVCRQLASSGHTWLQGELTSNDDSPPDTGVLATMFVPTPQWDRKLDLLAGFASSAKKKKPQGAQAEYRLSWIVRGSSSSLELAVLLQKRGKRAFSKGKNMSPRKLFELREEPWMKEHDRKVISAIAIEPGYRGRGVDYRFSGECFAELAGHPRVYSGEDEEPLEIVVREPTLRVVRKGGNIEICAIPWRAEGTNVEREGHLVIVHRVDKQHEELCQALGTETVILPAEAAQRLSSILGTLSSSLTLHTDIAPKGGNIEKVQPDCHIALKLRRSSDVLRVSYFVYPLGESGPARKPGKGNELLVADIAGVSTQTERILAEESTQERALFAACPSLAKAEKQKESLLLRGLSDTLTFLNELHKMGDSVSAVWMEGEPLRVDLSADVDSLRLRFEDTKRWLSADISVEISEGVQLRAHELVQKLVPGAPGFVQLEDNQFVALSDELRRKIESLASLGQLDKKRLSIGPANAYALSAWLGDLSSKATTKGATLAGKRLAKVRESSALIAPIPDSFRAELRSYQLEAFHWMSRLAHWGGGALLCDDMGLGKTVQMLAIFDQRRTLGPALVVAPVSVGPHWSNLMRQFAPMLKPRTLTNKDRAHSVSELSEGDVLIVSYGLLHSECDLLSSRSFSTIVLDEAQAIKNPRSQRARAAFKLQGDFRVVTTGTPVENHLGELWSIMNFANPGLLGSSKHFSDVFGKPIQKHGDKKAGEMLRATINPFFLRRTKDQVLTELPPKTEITLEIEPGPKEAEFYASIRDAMLAEVKAGLDRPAAKRLQILGALMKLRRIACHPSLGDAGVGVGSAKQERFLELVDELKAAGHRILVFSQFVGHLAIARTNLDARKISYQYLDGSTSKAKRKKAVEAFQAGEGDLFLISLKAGGVGLHLTGADYVIHLDPWWNPAVENQASDRAHRIGQTRPVTVYRLITKGTVEETVLALHARKRQLAEDLVAGSENAGSLGVDELLGLLEASGA
ncbi:MAG: DEAD/DEAH box helicase [Kofleriaceae bacterium]|nr:DEAD/DEAH box helicase [Kofleriaceae bacterium]